MHGHLRRGSAGIRVGMEAMIVGEAVALDLIVAPNRSMRGVEARRLKQERIDVEARVQNAARLGAVAESLANDLATARAENVRLRRQLERQQQWIDVRRG